MDPITLLDTLREYGFLGLGVIFSVAWIRLYNVMIQHKDSVDEKINAIKTDYRDRLEDLKEYIYTNSSSNTERMARIEAILNRSSKMH